MATTKKIFFLALVPLLAAFILVGGFAAKANPLDIIQSNVTATTTIAYMTPGTATTTYAYDSYMGGVGDPNATDKAALMIQFTASSTSSVLNWKYQFSQNGIDWYEDNTNPAATTSTNVTADNSYIWTAAASGDNRKIVTLPEVPTRYVRAVFSVTGANAGTWASFVTQKQQPE